MGAMDQVDKRKGEEMKPLGVAMIIASFHPLIGGAERQAQQLAARLIKKGLSVCILTRRYKGLKRYEAIDGIPVYRVLTIGQGILASFSYTFFSLLWLFRNGDKCQIIHCHQALSPATIGVIAKLMRRKKVMVKIACSGEYGDVAQIRSLPLPGLRRKLLGQVDYFVAVNDEIEQELRDFGLVTAPVEVFPNGVDIDRFCPANEPERHVLRDRLSLPQSAMLAVFAGRLEPQKNVDNLLLAWKQVELNARPGEDARLLILGDGTQKSALVALAEQLDITNSVHFIGRVDQVGNYLRAADLFVLPSRAEGLSNALLEAMACGLAVVATDIGGNNEIVSHLKNGILVRPRDSEQLAAALLMVLSDTKLARRLGEEARKTIGEGYSLESVTKQYIELYRGLLPDGLREK